MALSIHRREYDHHTEQVHAVGGPWVRDVMLGLNDGLVASFAVTSGVAGAFSARNIVIMAGLSEMLGGAVAMGLGGALFEQLQDSGADVVRAMGLKSPSRKRHK